jgi:hypothetical protein
MGRRWVGKSRGSLPLLLYAKYTLQTVVRIAATRRHPELAAKLLGITSLYPLRAFDTIF